MLTQKQFRKAIDSQLPQARKIYVLLECGHTYSFTDVNNIMRGLGIRMQQRTIEGEDETLEPVQDEAPAPAPAPAPVEAPTTVMSLMTQIAAVAQRLRASADELDLLALCGCAG